METLKQKLCCYLDSIEIFSRNIGKIRKECFLPFDSEWNAFVRDETAKRENKPNLWGSIAIREALASGRGADDIAILDCPKCGRDGYYNQGSHFHCRFCNVTFATLSEDESSPADVPSIRLDDMRTLADTLDELSGPDDALLR